MKRVLARAALEETLGDCYFKDMYKVYHHITDMWVFGTLVKIYFYDND